jgi:hypothetical protein
MSIPKFQHSQGQGPITNQIFITSSKSVDFSIDKVKHEVHSILAFYLNHNQLCCSNQDHKKKHHAQEHKKYPGKPFSTREENPAKSFAIFFKRKTFTTKKT